MTLHPEVQEAVAAEAWSFAGDRPINAEDLPRLSVTDRVIRETLRLYPSAWWADRMSLEDVELGGYAIPARTPLGS